LQREWVVHVCAAGHAKMKKWAAFPLCGYADVWKNWAQAQLD